MISRRRFLRTGASAGVGAGLLGTTSPLLGNPVREGGFTSRSRIAPNPGQAQQISLGDSSAIMEPYRYYLGDFDGQSLYSWEPLEPGGIVRVRNESFSLSSGDVIHYVTHWEDIYRYATDFVGLKSVMDFDGVNRYTNIRPAMHPDDPSKFVSDVRYQGIRNIIKKDDSQRLPSCRYIDVDGYQEVSPDAAGSNTVEIPLPSLSSLSSPFFFNLMLLAVTYAVPKFEGWTGY